MEPYQKYIAASRYARWLPEEGRRETWEETVGRYTTFWKDKGYFEGDLKTLDALEESIRNLEVMPSMRCLMTAGKALDRDNVAGFNCSYLAIEDARCFDELMYILMCGTGVGFSVETPNVASLPSVPDELCESEDVIVVRDSKIGWAESYRSLLAHLYDGRIPRWDVSKVRPAGAALKTFGGRASGPQPLVDLFRFTVELFRRATGRRLSSLECHDICCKIADIVVVGGVRRSALIGLSSPSDQRIRDAKHGEWHVDNAQRALANNSACYRSKPEFPFFMKEMMALYESKSGERGVFSRVAAKAVAARNGRRDAEQDFGTNPCSEIILRPKQFCNLTEVVVRPDDTLEELKEKVRKATILGTLQATLTNFRYLRKKWKDNTEEEALLGVSLTGIMDHPVLSGNPDNPPAGQSLEQWLEEMRDVAIATNKEWAARLGIKESAAITCVKPSGTVSQLVNSASGIHPRFADRYIRRVMADAKDPLAQYMEQAGFPCEDSVYQDNTKVFSFPIETKGAGVTVDDVGAMEQLRIWKIYQDHWCEHKPSITVYYTDDEFFEICQWMWENFDSLSGISLLPKSDHSYSQAPYEVNDELFDSLEIPEFNWDDAAKFELEDMTTGSQELACVGNSCEL